jgi:DNA-binding response OmpR family regulator
MLAERKEEKDMSGAHLLLVEDDDVLRELLLRNLQAREHDVAVAEDAQAALAHLRTSAFDLIILDICLPDQTGWEVLRVARKEGWLAPVQMNGHAGQVPVAVLSAVRVSPHRLQEFHPLAYLPKPFPMEALLRLAAEAAQRRNGNTVTELEDEEGAERSRNTVPHKEDWYA